MNEPPPPPPLSTLSQRNDSAGASVLFNNLIAHDYSSLQRMIPPACNMALTFTAEGGAADWISGSRLGHPLQIGHQRHWEKTAKEWESSLGEGRETGERQEGKGRNKEEREEEGIKAGKEERKDKRNKDGKRQMQITVEAEEEWILFEKRWVYLLLTPVLVSSGGEVEVFFTNSGRLLEEVETTHTAPRAPNKQQSLITQYTC